MKFSLLIKVIAAVTIIFGIYLLHYGAFCLWQYQDLLIPEVVEKDAHGMSRLVGYTFILLLGVVVLGLGSVLFMLRNLADGAVQKSVSSGLLIAFALAFLMSLYLQIVYWEAGWGRLYVGVFLLLALASGYFRFIRQRVS